MQNYAGFLFLLLPLFLLYLVFSRTRRQQRVFAEVQAGIRPGLRVMTTSGVHATVISIEDGGIVVLEIAPGVHTRWARAAVAEVFDPEQADREQIVDLTDDDGTDLTDADRTDRERDDRTLT